MTQEIKRKLIRYIIPFLVLFIAFFQGVGQNVIFPDSLKYCNTDSVQLDAGPGFYNYLWSTGDTTQTSWISQTGAYWVSLNQGDTLIIEEDFHVVLISAGIIQDDSTIICGDTIVLKGSDDFYSYLWTPGLFTDDSITVWPRETTLYYARLIDPDTLVHYCIDSVLVSLESIIVVDTTKQLSIGCPGENKARVQLEVTGGWPPYEYDWPPEAIPLYEDPSYAIGLSDGDKTVTITDTLGCFLDHNFYVKAHRLPDLELYSDPSDTAFLQNPYVTFSYENPMYDSLGVDTFYISWWEWNFGDSSKSIALSPTHIYQTDGNYSVFLKFKTFFECEGTDTINMLIKPVDLLIPNVITPNGDQVNDIFEIWEGTASSNGESSYKAGSLNGPEPIDLSKYYLSNSLVIFNRWGEKVFEIDNYENDWDGGDLTPSTYFYVLKCIGEHRTDVFKGTLTILYEE